ncbi:MAG: 50S ribosomal protein L29 [Pseudomonadota bacterium]
MSKKKNNIQDISGQTIEKLREQLALLKKELFNLRFQKAMGELKDASKFSVIRKDVARVNTELAKRAKLGGK